ncbi:hypothetical protein RIF29_22904 [Crotalaria pallida]|uniref:Uncharacterized protein n=1 Tax=Crotalaria pallida TaxID=3830 RepID=A0AAN9I8C0_CROPI
MHCLSRHFCFQLYNFNLFLLLEAKHKTIHTLIYPYFILLTRILDTKSLPYYYYFFLQSCIFLLFSFSSSVSYLDQFVHNSSVCGAAA